LVPLNRLREGTRRIASHDFATPVEVSTDDEFGDLAGSFNEMARQLDELVEDLRRHQLGTLRALARAIDERSPWTLGHSGRVARLVNQLAQRLGVASADRWDLHRAALLHDIGKLSIESDLLDQPGRLTPEQRSLIEQHVGAGVRILEPVPGYERIRPIVAQHHERLDGPQADKVRRMKMVDQLQESILDNTNRSLIGQTLEVLVDGRKKGKWRGRTRTDKLVFFKDGAERLGQLVDVIIDEAGPWSLQGTPVEVSPGASDR
jgi:putative nucleotidyltransferase with HDIG domain